MPFSPDLPMIYHVTTAVLNALNNRFIHTPSLTHVTPFPGMVLTHKDVVDELTRRTAVKEAERTEKFYLKCHAQGKTHCVVFRMRQNDTSAGIISKCGSHVTVHTGHSLTVVVDTLPVWNRLIEAFSQTHIRLQ